MLLKAGVIHEFQLNSALSFQRQLGGRLGASLIRLGYLDENRLLDFLAEQMELKRIDLDTIVIPESVVKLIPVAKALELSIVPVGTKEVGGNKVLFVAMADPTNIAAIDELKFIAGCQVKAAVAPEDAVIRTIKKLYGIDVPSPSGKSAAPSAEAKPTAETGGSKKGGKSTEDKLKELVKILVEKKILDRDDLERFKG